MHRVLHVPGRLPRHPRPRGEQARATPGPRFFIRFAELEMHPLDTNDRRELIRSEHGLGHVQHHQVLHRGLPRAHQHHRQRDHPAEGARRRRRTTTRWPGSAARSSAGPGRRRRRQRPRPRPPEGPARSSPSSRHRPARRADGRVLRFLSPEWFARFAEELAAVRPGRRRAAARPRPGRHRRTRRDGELLDPRFRHEGRARHGVDRATPRSRSSRTGRPPGRSPQAHPSPSSSPRAGSRCAATPTRSSPDSGTSRRSARRWAPSKTRRPPDPRKEGHDHREGSDHRRPREGGRVPGGIIRGGAVRRRLPGL